ncbi:hypothetical protein H9M94_03050 [Mycoplasma sp. Pen4]|uniref:hypothetical protein n=1 Tax=Mycoplasma sp. Pen4 TaxID=640330 RepID=UPI0016545FD9|nr:hypothetical protein [Mycoplasma sp. Pen4]QNM93557.1 hypothetical protein H9M94_03050 [Mycoplasma sp. Pen4]
MESNHNIIRKIKHAAGIIFISLVTLITIILSIVKFSTPFKPSFYNYKSYMSQANIKKVEKTFNYKVFDEINEFTTALVNKKAIAGIGSDFQAVNLIKKDLVKPINFKKLFKTHKDLTSDEIKKALKAIYTPIVWKHLESYDEQLKTDADGLPYDTPKHLWEYFIPYYAQDGVVAYNRFDKDDNTIRPYINNQDLLNNANKLNETIKYQDESKSVSPNSLLNLINTLRSKGYKNLVVTDAIRVNMLYGSQYELINKQSNFDVIKDNFTGKTTENNYKKQIHGFEWLLKKGTNSSNRNLYKNISFNADGQGILDTLINPKYNAVDSAILYNGDLLDAYYSENNYDTVEKGTIDGFKIGENVLLVDGFVVAKDEQSKYQEYWEDKIYEVLNDGPMQNYSEHYNVLEEFGFNQELAYQKYMQKFYEQYLTIVLKDLFQDNDVYKEIETDLSNIYLETLTDPNKLSDFRNYIETRVMHDQKLLDKFKEILIQLDSSNTELNNDELVTKITFLVNHVDFSNEIYRPVFEEKYTGLENFDFINYTPSTDLEYNLVKSNYFINEDNTYDTKAIMIYSIEDDLTRGITHKSIQGVDQELLSKIGTYYFNVFKS